MHAAADAARTWGVADDVRCDLGSIPPGSPLAFILGPTARYYHQVSLCPTQALHPACLRQETLALVASCSTRAARLYYTDTLVGEKGTAGAAFVCGPLIVAHRLPPYTTAFQAELTAVLLALRHGSEGYVGDTSFHRLPCLTARPPSRLSERQHPAVVHQQLAVLYWNGTAVTCHLVSGHVGVSGNERVDTAAQLTGAGPRVTFTILRSTSSIKTAVNRAAMKASRSLFDTAVEEGSRSVS